MSLFKFFKDFFFKYRLNDSTSKILFDHYFFDLKYYLRNDASIKDLSNLLNISIQTLDQITTENYAFSCELLINKYRYKHLIAELESPLNSSLTIESIMKLSGFENNKNFVEYIKKMKVSNNKLVY